MKVTYMTPPDHTIPASDYQWFLDNKDDLTEKLATAMEAQLILMGENAKGISWFSSVAKDWTKV